MEKSVLCIKLGGSVITNKNIPYTANKEVLHQIAQVIKTINQPLIISHGSGGFGHTSARRYGGKNGYSNPWGIAKVAYDATSINHIVMESLISQKIPVISFSPRSFLVAKHGVLHDAFYSSIHLALEQKLVPVVFGDIVWDSAQKSTIFSGEIVLAFLINYFKKHGNTFSKIIQLTNVDGVLDTSNSPIPNINSANWPKVKQHIKKVENDVTGGMMHKIDSALVNAQNGIQTVIINGQDKDQLIKVLQGNSVGTLIS